MQIMISNRAIRALARRRAVVATQSLGDIHRRRNGREDVPVRLWSAGSNMKHRWIIIGMNMQMFPIRMRAGRPFRRAC